MNTITVAQVDFLVCSQPVLNVWLNPQDQLSSRLNPFNTSCVHSMNSHILCWSSVNSRAGVQPNGKAQVMYRLYCVEVPTLDFIWIIVWSAFNSYEAHDITIT